MRYNPAVADELIARIRGLGPYSPTSPALARKALGLSHRTVLAWVARDEHGFRGRYAAARSWLLGYWVDELLALDDG